MITSRTGVFIALEHHEANELREELEELRRMYGIPPSTMVAEFPRLYELRYELRRMEDEE